MTHSLPTGLKWGSRSIGYFSRLPATRLVIFIHGFGGKATKTWKGMERLLTLPNAVDADVAFYGYGSLAAPAQNSATLFRKFIVKATTASADWTQYVQAAVPGRPPPEYTSILIVAHSLGAVVARRAILDGLELGEGWPSITRLVLFGPAHTGTRLVELKNMLKSGIGSILSDLFTAAQVNVPVLDDLAEGSLFLDQLKTESEAQIKAGNDPPIGALFVLFGEHDNVVRTFRFCSDPISEVADGEDHCSVCRMPEAVRHVAAFL